MKAPAISVVVLTRDRSAEFRGLLSALARQRRADFEVIVVGALDSVEEHGAAPAMARRITYARCEARNISKSRNIGLSLARGAIVAFIDDDAAPEPDWLDELAKGFSAEDVGGVGGFVRGRNGVDFQWRGTLVDRYGGHLPFTFEDYRDYRAGDAGRDRFLSTVGVNGAFRRGALEAVGGFDENFHYFLDESDLCMRLQAAGWRIVLAPDAEVHHAYAASNQRQRNRAPRDLFEIAASRLYFSRRYGDPAEIEEKIGQFVKDQGERLTKFVQLGRLSRRQARTIADRIQDGLIEGERRFRNGPQIGGRVEAKLVVPAEASFLEEGERRRPRVALVVTPLTRLSVNRAARRLAEGGCEVTMIDFQYRARRLRVWFQDGVWRHVGGVLGRDKFGEPLPVPRRHARVRKEIDRIDPRRDFDVVFRPAARRYRIGDLRPARLTGALAGYVAEPMRPGGARQAIGLLDGRERSGGAGRDGAEGIDEADAGADQMRRGVAGAETNANAAT